MALPFDNAKTKIQKMKPDAAGVMPYKNIFDCMWKVGLINLIFLSPFKKWKHFLHI